jgi:hypothetical protein
MRLSGFVEACVIPSISLGSDRLQARVRGERIPRAGWAAPGPFNVIHAEVPNRMFGTFPFMFIPGFFVPLAVTLHVLAIRAIRSRLRTGIGINLAGAQRAQTGSQPASV